MSCRHLPYQILVLRKCPPIIKSTPIFGQRDKFHLDFLKSIPPIAKSGVELKYIDSISGIFWFACGLLLSLLSTKYQIGSLFKPGPGFLPFALGILLMLLSFMLLVSSSKRVLSVEQTKPSSMGVFRKRVLPAILIMLIACFAFDSIGSLITIFLLTISLMLVVGTRDWRKLLLTAFFSTLFVYLVFALLLQLDLPTGFFGI